MDKQFLKSKVYFTSNNFQQSNQQQQATATAIKDNDLNARLSQSDINSEQT